MRRFAVVLATVFAGCAILAACGGSSGGGTPATAKPSSSASPTAEPSSSASPTASPSAAPTPEYAFPSPQATMPSSVGSVTVSQPPVTVSANFGAATAGSGTILVNFSLSTSDVSPATLPADNATSGYAALIYGSFYNPTSSAISFGTQTPAITVTDTSGFGSATTCELDVYSNGSGTGYSWATIPGATGTVSGESVSLARAAVTGGGGLQITGQQIVAISCN